MPAEFSDLSRADRAKYYVANLFIRAMIGAMRLLPYCWRIPAMGWLLSRVVAPLVGSDKRVRGNLQHACPELDEAEVQRLCRAVPDNVGRTLMEQYAGKPFRDRAANFPIDGPGLEPFLKARENGQPVLIMTGHFGNYLAARAKLAALGHPVGALYRRMANPYFNEIHVASMQDTGKTMFEQGRRGMVEMVRYLKGGGIVGIVGDMHVQEGVELKFFGQPALTSTVPAELALKQKALLVPVYAIRQPNGLDFEIVMQEPITHTDPVTMTQEINDGLEALIREHMDQWFWIHRRWKSA
jgi:Kdo2-lipid IVA lauroyltransferase/acyltransferase